jgi:SAM-dependent methyltransferase
VNANDVRRWKERPAAFFVEDYTPGDLTKYFDQELNKAVEDYALNQGALCGYCNINGEPTTFQLHGRVFREDLVCATTNSISRHRQMVAGMSMALFGNPFYSLPMIADYVNESGRKIYLTEISTPLFTFLKKLVRPELFIASEYLDASHRSGTVVKGVLHQDLVATSFADNTFDIVLTSEVLEHVPHAEKAEAEIVRIMKPNGVYCFTVPIDVEAQDDIILARAREGGEIEYFGEPVFHGDPVRAEGILAYRIFSAKGLKKRFSGLGCSFACYRFWSKTYGIIGPDSWVLVARGPKFTRSRF